MTDYRSWKETVVLVPLIGSTLALTFDAGYFWGLDINFFTIFSLSEHVVFALQVMPLAFIATMIFLLLPLNWVMSKKERSQEESRAKNVPLFRRGAFWGLIIYVVACLIGYLIWHGILFLFMAVAVMLISIFRPRILHMGAQGPFLFFLMFTLTGTFLVGLDIARSYRRSDRFPQSIATLHEVWRVKVVRTGERGVLFIEGDKRMIRFLPWDEIKNISSDGLSAF